MYTWNEIFSSFRSIGKLVKLKINFKRNQLFCLLCLYVCLYWIKLNKMSPLINDMLCIYFAFVFNCCFLCVSHTKTLSEIALKHFSVPFIIEKSEKMQTGFSSLGFFNSFEKKNLWLFFIFLCRYLKLSWNFHNNTLLKTKKLQKLNKKCKSLILFYFDVSTCKEAETSESAQANPFALKNLFS
jgi:hypothetical protein